MLKLVRSFMSGIISYCESVGTARAASELARIGRHEEARALMMSQHKR